jgi:integrase
MRKSNNTQLAVRQNAALVPQKRERHPNRALTEAEIRQLLHAIDNIRDDALIRLGLSVGLRFSEVVTITTSAIDFDRQLIKIWDEKKDRWRLIMPTLDSLRAIRQYLNTLPRESQYLFPVSTKTV